MIRFVRWEHKKSNAKFVLSEYTTQHGCIIFDESKGGSVTNAVSLRLNKNLSDLTRHSEAVSSQSKAFIDIYVDMTTHTFKLLDFASLKGFRREVDENLELFECKNDFKEPIIDISTWVSNYGVIKHPTQQGIKYLYTECQVDLKIVHNRHNILKMCFGDEVFRYCLNECIIVYTDSNENFASITFGNASKLIEILKS